MTESRMDHIVMELARIAGSAVSPATGGEDAGFDDGLVHDHGWACSERGAPAY